MKCAEYQQNAAERQINDLYICLCICIVCRCAMSACFKGFVFFHSVLFGLEWNKDFIYFFDDFYSIVFFCFL